MSISANIVILSKTKMSGDNICVGAYDIDNDTMIRLLDFKARTLDETAPYEIGEFYHIKYAQRYQRTPPHVEDVAVYEHEQRIPQGYIDNCGENWFYVIIHELCEMDSSLSSIFSGKLLWENNKGYTLENDPPDHSVCIVSFPFNLKKNGEYYPYMDGSGKMIKYVGKKEIRELPSIIPKNTPIRLSLARPWDKNGDGNKRCYMQLSGAYL